MSSKAGFPQLDEEESFVEANRTSDEFSVSDSPPPTYESIFDESDYPTSETAPERLLPGPAEDDGRLRVNLSAGPRTSAIIQAFTIPVRPAQVVEISPRATSNVSSREEVKHGAEDNGVLLDIALFLIGSREEIKSCMRVGQQLRHEGHRVRVATHSIFQSLSKSLDLEFFSISSDPEHPIAKKDSGLMTGLLSTDKALVVSNQKMLNESLKKLLSRRPLLMLPRPGTEVPSGSSFLAELAPGWITVASIQGRIYNEIYSPGALVQPPHIRTSRAQAMAAELKGAMQHAQDIHDHYEASKGQVLGLEYHEIARRSDRVIGLSMLTLIYRSVTPDKSQPSKSAFCHECIDAARATLEEHDRCVAAIIKAQGKTVLLEAYVNWTITHSPFIPFIVLFCHIIETCEASDLELMRSLVETLESTSDSRIQRTCDKQRHLFKALHHVAAKYVEVRSRADDGQEGVSWPMAWQQQYTHTSTDAASNGLGVGRLDLGGFVADPPGTTTTTTDAPGIEDRTGVVDGLAVPMAFPNTAFDDVVNMEMDFSGAELWDWFNKNQAIMRMLEDT